MAKQVFVGLTMLAEHLPVQHNTGYMYGGIEDATILEQILVDPAVNKPFEEFLKAFGQKALEYGIKKREQKAEEQTAAVPTNAPVTAEKSETANPVRTGFTPRHSSPSS